MWDTFIIVCIAISVLSMILPFVFMGIDFRRSDKEPSLEENTDKRQIIRNTYLNRYVYRYGGSVSSRKAIRIRPEYYDLIKEITQVIGEGETPMVSYLDNVLKVHFSANETVINDLYREKSNDLINSKKL